MIRHRILTIALLLTSVLTASSQEVVKASAAGRGSYASYAPLAMSKTAEHDGDQSQYMQHRRLYVKEAPGQPIPTNDWWTDLMNADRQRSGQEVTGHLWSYPQYVQGMRYGVDVHYPKYWVDNGTEMKAQSKLMVKGDGFEAAQPLAEQWSDWTVSFSLLPQGAADYAAAAQGMLVTLAHGMPFTWIETKGTQPVVSAVKTGNDGVENTLTGKTVVTFLDAAGQPLTSGTCSRFVVSIDRADSPGTGDLYGIFLPEGASVTFDGGEARITFGSSRQFVVVALLKQAADLTFFADYAYSKPTDTEVSWDYAQATGTLTTHWRVTATELNSGEAASKVLQGFIPHHYRNGAVPGFPFTGCHYRTPRGILKLAEGSDLSVSYRFAGMLPWYALPTDVAGLSGEEGTMGGYDKAKMLQMLASYAQQGTFGRDTYWGGKGLTQMALYMTFAREMGEEQLFRQCHDRLKEALVDWLTYTPGESDYFFARDQRFGGLVGYATSYDSETYNDHHFHYGYYTLSAALLCMVDDDFRQHYGDMLRLVARDYNNYKRDSWACFLRMMDPWAGHCYAGGMGDGAGNGQESTSESMQAWGGMYLLGVALGDTELRDAGIFGWVTEARATAEYWFDRHGEAVGSSFHTGTPDYDAADVDNLYNIDYAKFVHKKDGVQDYVQPWNSNLTSHGVGWWTWFGGDPVFMQGIQWMPISPALDYLGEDVAFAEWDYQRLMVIKEHAGWGVRTGEAQLADSDWGNVVLSYRQWGDADDAARIFDEGWAAQDPTMYSRLTNGITYFVTHSHRTYGDIVWDVTADYPTARVYRKGGVTTHIAYNPTDHELTVHYSDGVSLVVPARQLKVEGMESTAYNYVYPVDDTEEDLRERLVMPNLALGKTCSESSHQNVSTIASHATDGDLTTRWGSEEGKDGEWLQVDLGECANIYQVRIRWETAYASEYRIELRDTPDGAVTYSVTGTGKENDWTELPLGDRPARYVRVVGVKRATTYGTSLYELEVYGRPSSAADGSLMGVEISSADAVLKQGKGTLLTLQGYDYARQPMDVSAAWSSEDGTFDGTSGTAVTFTPAKYGTVSVTAMVEGLTAVKVLPVEESLRLTTLQLSLAGDAVIGQPVAYTSEALDQFGTPMAVKPSCTLYEVTTDGDLVATSRAGLDTDAQLFTAYEAGLYAIVLRSGSLETTVQVRGIGPSGLSYGDIPSLNPVGSMSGRLPLFTDSELPPMNFSYNGGSLKGSDAFPVPVVGGGTTRALFVSQLGTFGFGALGNVDLSDYNMLHADIFVTSDAPQFSFHIEGAPANREYAKALKSGQWNAVDVPVTNTTCNWLFFAFSNYLSGTGEALVANVYFYKASGDKVFVSDPDSKGIVSVTSFGTGITDSNKAQFLADVAALPATATAIDLSGITLSVTTPITLTTKNPNVILLLNGSGGDDNAASDQQAMLTNTQNLAYNAGGWILPLKATGFRVVLEDGYAVLPMNFGRTTTLTYQRTLAGGAYGTLCLPRDVTLPAGVEAYELSSASAAGINFSKVTATTLSAYQPYLLRNTTSVPVEVRIDGVAGNAELARGSDQLTTTVDGVRFIGNFQQFQVTGSEGYAAFKSSGQLAWLNNAGSTVGSFRAYLADAPASAAKLLIDGEVVTGIDILTPFLSHGEEAWYSLDGRKLQGRPTVKGVYIYKGKKVKL